MRFLGIAIILMLAGPAFAQEAPTSFSAAKKYLADLHESIGHQTTLYCGCPYERTTRSGGDVDRETCGVEARKNEERADRVEWEHVVPASWFGQARACWILKETAYPECEGQSGRKCCERVNEHFSRAHNDPNNLFPSSGEVNGDRSNHPYGDVEGEERVYGSCDFEIGPAEQGKIAEPSELSKGAVARAMLYMSEVYGVNVRLPFNTLWQWHVDNPVQPWEAERAQRIADDTGQRNRWILGD
jgi:deoxyribonuclease-1